MIPEKNLSRLIDAYGMYRKQSGSDAWDLVLVGSGPGEITLRQQVSQNRIRGVLFAGNCQIHELPLYYAHAKCFVLPSTSEPWGLVVNEAMASGLPVLASNRCGCVRDLVHDGVNGFTFDPFNQKSLIESLLNISSGSVSLEDLAANGRKIIAQYTPQLFAQRASAHFRSLCDYVAAGSDAGSVGRSLRRAVAGGVYSVAGLSTLGR